MTHSLQVSAAIAPLLAKPGVGSEQTSQLLRGHSALLLAEEGDWLRVCGADGYEGWTHSGYTFASKRGDEPEKRVRGMSLDCTVRDARGEISLPFGAFTYESDEILRGREVSFAAKGELLSPDAESVVQTARESFCGAPYQWGGITPWGADCSGFVQSVFSAHGILIPRDSGAQAAALPLSPATPLTAAVGDLLFFASGPRADATTPRAITHVGISMGNGEMAHISISRGGYREEDFKLHVNDSYTANLLARFLSAASSAPIRTG